MISPSVPISLYMQTRILFPLYPDRDMSAASPCLVNLTNNKTNRKKQKTKKQEKIKSVNENSRNFGNSL